MILHHSLVTTSACKISDEMFFNNIIIILLSNGASMILHHSLVTTSACKISDEMFFNNIIIILLSNSASMISSSKHFYCPFSSDFFLANLISLSLLGLESFGSFYLNSEFLVVSYSLTAYCKCWLPCLKLRLHYE